MIISVSNPGCLSLSLFIPRSRILILSIPDPGSRIKQQEKRRGKNLFVALPFFLSPQISKTENYLFLKQVQYRKFFWPIHKQIEYGTFYPKKLSIASQKYGLAIRDPEKTSPGSRGIKAPDPGFGSATLIIYKNLDLDSKRQYRYRYPSSSVLFMTFWCESGSRPKPLINRSGSGSCVFSPLTFKTPTNTGN
jgi:hypothetical protein